MRKPERIELITDHFENHIVVAYNRHNEILAEFAIKQHDVVPEKLAYMFSQLARHDHDCTSEEFWETWEREASRNRI